MSNAQDSLEFEKPYYAIQEKIKELVQLSTETHVDFQAEIEQLSAQAESFRRNLYENLSPKDKVQIARHAKRPTTLDIVQQLSPETWFELHGNRAGADDHAIVGGLIELNERPVMMVGTQKGKSMKEKPQPQLRDVQPRRLPQGGTVVPTCAKVWHACSDVY